MHINGDLNFVVCEYMCEFIFVYKPSYNTKEKNPDTYIHKEELYNIEHIFNFRCIRKRNI